MGIVNVRKGLGSEIETYSFNGSIRDNLNLNWEYAEIYMGSEKLDPDYTVKEDDLIIIQEYPEGTGTGSTGWDIFLGVITGGIYTGIIAYNKAKEAEKDLQRALDRLKNQKNQGEQETIPWLAGGRNERALGKQVPIILGRHLFTPYFLSDPYLKPSGTDGEDLFWYGTFICGQTGLVIEQIRNGSTKLLGFSDTQKQTIIDRPFYTPDNYNSDDPPPFCDPENRVEIIQDRYFSDMGGNPIFDQKWVDSLESSVELERKKTNNQTRKQAAKVRAEAAQEELILALASGDSARIAAARAEVAAANLELVQATIENSNDILDGGDEPVIRESAKFPMRLEVEIFVDGLCGWDSNNSVETTADIEISLKWGTSNSNISNSFDDITGWTASANGHKLSRKTSKQMRFIAYVDLATKGIYNTESAIKLGSPVYVQAVRKTPMRTGGYRDRVYISAIRTKLYSPDRSSPNNLVEAKNLNKKLSDKLCRIGIKLKVNKNTEKALDKFNIVASMTARTWDGVQWSSNKVKTSNPAAVALEVLTGLIHELSEYRIDPDPAISEIDLKSFGRLYEFCERQQVNIEGSTVPVSESGLQANGVIASASRKIDVLKSILTLCEAGLYVNEFGKIIVYYDDYQTTPIALLNPQRIVKMQESRNLNRRAEGYKVDFIDEDADWTQDTKEILRPGEDENNLENTFTPIKFDLTTSYKQAMWKARRLMAKEILRPGETTVSVGKEGRLYSPGSLIKVQHEGFKIGLGSGEIIEVLREGDYITGFRLMERFDISIYRDYFIEYFVVNENDHHVVEPLEGIYGQPSPQILKLQSVGEYTDTLMLSTPIPADSFYTPEMFNILSVMYSETGTNNTEEKDGILYYKIYESKRYLVTGLNPTQQGYDLTLVQYDDEIYKTTTIDKIPAYKSSILSKPPGVYDSYGRKPTDSDPGQGLIDPPALAQIVPPIITRITPRYRGAASVADFENTGIISTNHGDDLIMNGGDYVMFNGNATGSNPHWRPTYMYQWDAAEGRWYELDESVNWDKYLDGVSDLTAGAPRAVFSTAFIKELFAQTVNADLVRARMRLQVGEDNSHIEINGQSNVIKSSNYDPDTPAEERQGFIINGNGEAEFNNVSARGHIEADSGYIKNASIDNVTIGIEALFTGSIVSGPLTLTNETPISGQIDYGIGTSARTIVTGEANRFGLSGYDIDVRRTIIGTYNSRNIIQIRLTGMTISISNQLFEHKVYVVFDDGQEILIASQYIASANLTSTLSFRYASGGKTFKLTDLPTQNPYVSGAIWRNGNQLMIS